MHQICKRSTNLIVEFVAPEDDMVRALLRERAVVRPDYTEGNYLRLLQNNAVVAIELVQITQTRYLYFLRATADESR